MKSVEVVICHECGKVCDRSGIGTGYGTDRNTGVKTCYTCIGKNDERALSGANVGDKFTHYLTKKGGEYFVCNWPSSMKFRVYGVRKGRHNMAGSRYDVNFSRGGKNFIGTNYGEDSQILHIRCIK